MNKVIVDDLRLGNTIPTTKLQEYRGIADAALLFNKSVYESGMNVHMMINNLLKKQMHRDNGISKINFRYSNTSNHQSYLVPTEGYIGTMNYMHNKYILDRVNETGSF